MPEIPLGVRALILTALLSGLGSIGAPLHGQELPADRFEIMIKFDRGRLVCARATARLILSDRYRRRLRPGVSDDRLVTEFADAIDREFRLMPKPYFYTLTDAEKVLDRANRLNGDADINAAREWSKSWLMFPRLRFFAEDTAAFNQDLGQVATRSGLAGYLAPDGSDDFSRRPRVFAIRDPFRFSEVKLPAPDGVIDKETIRDLLAPMERLPGNPDAIRAVLVNYYAVRGITPRIDIDLDRSSKEIRIFKADQIAHLELPLDATPGEAELLVYETMPARVYRAFRKQASQIMGAPLASDARKRPVDIAAVVASAEGAGSTFDLPFNESMQLQTQQQRLIPLGFQASLFDFDAGRRLVDLVIDRTTPQAGAAGAGNSVLGTAETPGNASNTTARPASPADIEPMPVTPGPRAAGTASGGVTPRPVQKSFVGGGLEYRPEQGVRLFGTAHRSDLFGRDQLSVEAGGQGSGFGTGRYVRDYVGFGHLHRRLSIDFNGGTDFTQERIFAGVLTDERRSGGAGRAELELFRDLDGHRLAVSVEGRRQTVRLLPHEGSETVSNLTTLDLGLNHTWSRRLARRPASLSLAPSLRLGLGLNPADPAYQRFRVEGAYHSLLAGPVDVDVRVTSANASGSTPVFELPSLGAEGSVRGFRTDDAIGRRLWSVQNELWFPLPQGGGSVRFFDSVLRNLRVAGLYDFGGMDAAFASADGVRQGAGVGLRMRYQGVILAFDWAHGFGKGALGDGRGRFYFNLRLP